LQFFSFLGKIFPMYSGFSPKLPALPCRGLSPRYPGLPDKNYSFTLPFHPIIPTVILWYKKQKFSLFPIKRPSRSFRGAFSPTSEVRDLKDALSNKSNCEQIESERKEKQKRLKELKKRFDKHLEYFLRDRIGEWSINGGGVKGD
jgi:hypothetical protein